MSIASTYVLQVDPVRDSPLLKFLFLLSHFSHNMLPTGIFCGGGHEWLSGQHGLIPGTGNSSSQCQTGSEVQWAFIPVSTSGCLLLA